MQWSRVLIRANQQTAFDVLTYIRAIKLNQIQKQNKVIISTIQLESRACLPKNKKKKKGGVSQQFVSWKTDIQLCLFVFNEKQTDWIAFEYHSHSGSFLIEKYVCLKGL